MAVQQVYTKPNIFTGGPPQEQAGGRGAMREALIGHKAERALAFQTAAVRLYGPAAGIFCRQLLFWDGRGMDPDGWIYKSQSDWDRETGLLRRDQEKARKALKGEGGGRGKSRGKGKPVLEEKRALGPDGRWRLFYRLDLQALMDRLGDELQPSTKTSACTTSCTGSMSSLVSRDYAQLGVPTKTEEDAEENPEDFPLQGAAAAAAAPKEEDPSGGLAEAAPVRQASCPVEAGAQSGSTAGEGGWGKRLASDLAARGVDLALEDRKKYGANFKHLETAGHGPDVMGRVVARIVGQWDRIPLSPQQALKDVQAGRDAERKTRTASPSGAALSDRGTKATGHDVVPTDSATPAAALEAIRARGPLAKYADVAQAHDFTQDAPPSGQWWIRLGGTDNERGTNAKSLGSVARRAMKAERIVSRTRIAQGGLEGGDEGSNTPGGDEDSLIRFWDEDRGRITPGGAVGDDVKQAAEKLQDASSASGSWLGRYAGGTVGLDDVVKTVCQQVYGRPDPPSVIEEAQIMEIVVKLCRDKGSEAA